MRRITPAQNRKIHSLAKEYGLDSDLLHSVVQSETGKSSLKELTVMEAVKVIDRLEGRGQSYDSTREHMTYRQEAYIKGLAKDLGWTGEDGKVDKKRIDGFVRKFYGVDSHKFLSRSMASKVIEGLKSLLSKEVKQEA